MDSINEFKMRNLIKFIFILCLGISSVFCSKDPPPHLKLSINEISIGSRGGVLTVEVESNVAWKVASNFPNWVLLSPSSGEGNGTIQVSALPNTKYARTADILIFSSHGGTNVSATLKVTQSLLSFDVDHANVCLENDGGEARVMLNTEAEWSVLSAPEWATVSPASGNGSGTVTLSASINQNKRERAGTVSFSYYDALHTISLSQKGDAIFNKPPEKPELLYPPNNSESVSTFPRFEWKCVDPDGDDLTYTLCVSEDGVTFTEYGPFTDTAVFLNGELKEASLHYYKVKADDGDHGETWSDIYCFETIDRTIYADGEVIEYMTSSKPNPVVLLFTGDGYRKQECGVGGLFEQNAIEGIEALFEVEPYRSYREYFSVYIVFAHSLESGATQIDQGIYKMTAFGTSFDDEGTHMTTNTDKAFDYALKVPGMSDYGLRNTCVFMMVNQDRYAGTCWMWTSGRSVAICPVSRRGGNYSYASVVLHEGGGHGFGRLADEYINNNTQIPESEIDRYRSNQSTGMYLNVDFTSDPQRVLWAHFLGLSGYGRVGVFEGGALYRYGAWRSEETNCMINNIHYFSAACREQIVKRILTISEEGYTLDKFLERDYLKTPNAALDMETKMFDSAAFVPLAPPVLVW